MNHIIATIVVFCIYIIPGIFKHCEAILSTMAHLDIFRQLGFVYLTSTRRFKVKIN